MKRTILCAVAVVMAAVSCQKSIELANPAEEGKGTIDICVNGLMGEYTQVDGTKAELVNTVRVSWKGGETVYVFDGVKCLGSLAASLEGDEDRYAVLSTDGSTHKVSTPAQGTTTLTLVYSPLLTEAPAVNDGAISISLASQSGEKAPFVAYATLEYTGTTITNAVVPFKFATSVIKVNCTGLKAKNTIDKVTLSNVNTVCKLTLSGDGAPNVSGDVNGTITRTGDEYFAASKVNSEGEAVFQIAVPALETATGSRVLTITQGLENFKDMNFTKNPLRVAISVNTVCQIDGLPDGALPGLFTVSDNGTPTDPSDDKKVHFSQGNLVARINEGGTPTAWKLAANQYERIGDDLANSSIGTTAGYVDLFGWSTAKTTYGISTSRDDEDYSGEFVDWGKTIDGKGTWRTLSGGNNGEWQYLFDHHVHVWGTCNNDVPGLFIAPDGFEGNETDLSDKITDWENAQTAGIVFLPAAGHRDGSSIHQVDEIGMYWSSTTVAFIHEEEEFITYFAAFNSQMVGLGPELRRNGFSVRLVTDVK